MSLTRCPDCSTQVSTLASACPKCGRPLSAPPAPSSGGGLKIIGVIACVAAPVVWFLPFDGAGMAAVGAFLAGMVIFVVGRLME